MFLGRGPCVRLEDRPREGPGAAREAAPEHRGSLKKMRTGRATGPPGFTVIEILFAIAIVGLLASVALSKYEDYRERARVYQASVDVSAVSSMVKQYQIDNNELPDSLAAVGQSGKLDPWGRPYAYFNLVSSKGNGTARKDKKLNPLNTDFDLYSLGKDGQSQSSLQAKTSRDDVVRARDGRFIGLASDFDP
jgi:general secretion pathway protein G